MTRESSKKSDIPVGSQFSPGVVDLSLFVRALVAKSGDKTAIEQAVWEPSVRIRARASSPTRRNRSLPVEAAVQYGLLDSTYHATDLARQLANITGKELYAAFARHILLNCGGLRVLEGIAQMEADQIAITSDSLAEFLTSQGFSVREHNTAINSFRMWLAKAGVFPERSRGRHAWKVDKMRREEILPLDDEQVGILAGISPEEAAFVRALCRLNPEGWVRASDIRDAAEATEHVKLGRGSLPKAVLRRLAAAKLIEFDTDGTSGGKSSRLRLTSRFKADILEPFVSSTVAHLDAPISDYYRRRPQDIFADLDSTDTFAKGRALEAFAIFIMRQLGLRFIRWNWRAAQSTAQAEVDAVLSGIIGAVQTRWQVQCKNTTANVELRHVASEVGLAPVTQATHLLIVTRSRFTSAARHYADEIMKRLPLTIFLLDREDFFRIQQEPAHLFRVLREHSEKMSRLQDASESVVR